jgi:hypothetical protein
MKIKQLFKYVIPGCTFDTDTDKLVCVQSRKHASVDLCFKASNGNIPFAEIRLQDSGLWKDAEAVYEPACKLGEEICKRWHENEGNSENEG